MLEQYPATKIMFIDIETVPQHLSFDELDKEFQELWDKKSAYFRKDGQEPGEVYERAGIYAEFGKIICISAGVILEKEGERFLKVKSFSGDNERALLQEFGNVLSKFTSKSEKGLCGHNVREFDFPYIARRMIINNLPLPEVLDVAGKKPWEVKFIDTLDLWKFGDYKHYTSLALLTRVMGIPTPKDDIDGSQVAKVYYIDKDLPRIVLYCEKDVVATAQLLLRFKGEPLLQEGNIIRE